MQEQQISELASLLRPVLTRLTRKLRKLSPDNALLSQNERAVLVLLDSQERLLSAEIAVTEKITPQSTGQIIKHLDALGFIKKENDANDKRKVYLSLSSKGKKMILQVRKEREEWLTKAIAAVCSEKDQAVLLKATEVLNRLVDYN